VTVQDKASGGAPHAEGKCGAKRITLLLLLAGVVLAVMAVVYGPLLLPLNPSVLLGRADSWNYLGEMAFFMDYAVHHGEWPQWNPLLFCGAPFAANPQAALFYPVHILRSLLNSAPTPMGTFISLALMQGFHLLLLALGTFFLARDFRMGRLGALIAAIGYMASAAISFRLVQHWHLVAIAAWFPWQLLLFRRALSADTTRKKAFYGLASGLLFGIGILPGFPQFTMYAGTLFGCYWLLHRIAYGRPDGVAGGAARSFTSDVLLLGLLFGTAVLVAMPSLLPAAEMSAYAARAKQQYSVSLDPFPIQLNPFTDPVQLGRALLLFYGKQGIRMLGATAALLVLFCLRHRQRREVMICAALFLVMLDCCIEPAFPFGTVIAAVAPFQITEPQRAIVLGCLFWALLAGFGADALVSPAASRFTPRFSFLVYALLGSGILWALLEWIWLSPEYPISFGAWLIPALAFALMMVSFYRPLRTVAAWSVLLCVIGEAALWNHAYIPNLIRDNLYPHNPSALNKSPEFEKDNRRGVGGTDDEFTENTGMFALKPVINGYDPLTVERVHAKLAAPKRLGHYDRRLYYTEVTRVNATATLLGKRRFRLFEDGPSGPAVPSAAEEMYRCYPAADGLALLDQPIRYRQEKAERGSISLPVFDGKNGENELCISYRAEATGNLEVNFFDADRGEFLPGKTIAWTAPTDPFTEARLPLPDFVRIKTLVRPYLDAPEKQLEIGQVRVAKYNDNHDRIVITESRANAVSVRLDRLPKPATLCFMETRYPGWHASVDGKPVSIEPAFDVFQAVRVPGGTHQVTFAFDSLTVKAGAVIGALSTMAACAVLLFLLVGANASSRERPSAPAENAGERG